MLDKLKQLMKLKQIQGSLSKERVTAEKDGIKIVLNGKMEIEEIKLNPDLSKESQERVLKDCFNEAVRKIQALMIKKFSQPPDLNP